MASSRRLLLLCAIGAVLGFAGGGAAWLLLHLIGLITNFALFGRFGWGLPSFRDLDVGPRVVVAAVVGAVVVSLLARWAPLIKGHGIPEAIDAVLTKQSRVSPKTVVAKPLSAALAIGTGAPFGAEGPIIMTGGALGSLLGQVVTVSPAERKILLACGAAAGMAATFGAPLAAVVLATELLLFEFSTRAFLPLVVAASIAGGMHALLFGEGALFAVPSHEYLGFRLLPVFVVLGLAAGLLAVVIAKGLFLTEACYRRLPVSERWHPVIGAVGFVAVGLLVPRALGVGYDAIGDIINDRLALTAVAVLAGAKLVAWWLALASGTSGGTLAPILLIGAGFGSLFGAAVARLEPSWGVSPGLFALVAMAATFGGCTRATFTAMVFVFEITQDYQMMLPLMLAGVTADLVAGALLRDSILTEKLSRRGLYVHRDYEIDALQAATVGEIMTTAVASLPADATVADARRSLVAGHGAYPVVDGSGRCLGIVTRRGLLGSDLDDQGLALDLAVPPVTVHPGDRAAVAAQRLLSESVDHLPVVVDDRLVGICTRADVLRTRQHRIDAEQLQPGWGRSGVRTLGERGRGAGRDPVVPAEPAPPRADGGSGPHVAAPGPGRGA